MSTDVLTDRIVAVYVHGDLDALAGLYAPDAVVDCTVPHWQYEVRGAEEIERVLREDELGVPGRRVSSWRSGSTDDGFHLETEVHFRGQYGEQMWRSLHLFRIEDGQIVEHRLYCSGIWSSADIARHRAQRTAPV